MTIDTISGFLKFFYEGHWRGLIGRNKLAWQKKKKKKKKNAYVVRSIYFRKTNYICPAPVA